jgi:hypothetical protein
LTAFKKKFLNTATGKPLFSTTPLANLILLLPADEGNLSPTHLDDDEMQMQESETTPHSIPKEMEAVM